MSRSSVRLSVLVLLLSLYVCPLVARFPLLDPDEGLHAAITQEMVTRGDWVMPRFLGEPFLDKPILFFWSQAVSFVAFGQHEAAARIPGLVFGALGAIATGWLAATVLGSGGWLAALLYATLLVPMALAEVPVHDVAVVPFANVALLAFWRASRASSPRRSTWWAILAGLALGGAILTKGLTGVALVGVAHATLMLVERRLTPLVIVGGVIALAWALVVAAPWYIEMEKVQPGYLHYYFVERHLFGFATETQRHGSRPFLYYVPVLLAGGLPWILNVPFAWRRLRPASMPALTTPQADASRLGWTWLLTGWLFLSLAGSKLFTYALPLFPAIALLATVAWQSRGAARSAFDRVVIAQAVVCALLLPLVVAAVPIAMPVSLPAWTWGAALATLAGWAWIARAWTRGDERSAFALAPALGAVTVVTLLFGVMPRVGEVMSAKDLAAALNEERRLPPEVWVLRQRLGSVVFYLDPALRAEATPQRIVQVQMNDLRARTAPAGTVVAVATQDHSKISAFVAPGATFREAGRYRVYRAEALGVPTRSGRISQDRAPK